MMSEISEPSIEIQDNNQLFVAKIVIVGDSAVGKTNILLRFTDHLYKANHVATIGIDFRTKTLLINDTKIKMQIWDTAGQERFRTITETYYKGASGIIVTFSVTSRKSFQSVSQWVQQIKEQAPEQIPLMIVGNKIDALHREVTEAQGRETAEKYGGMYMQVSAREDINIQKLFEELGIMMMKAEVSFKQKDMKMLLSQKLSGRKRCC